MPQNDKTKKVMFRASLAQRAFLVCLAFLIVPLFIHSFLLYGREIRLKEQDVRTDLRAIGSEMAQRISDLIHIDWQILEVKSVGWSPLAAVFHAEKIAAPPNVPSHFAVINEQRKSLLAGVLVSQKEARAIAHPLVELLSLKEPASFPIDASFGNDSLHQDQWVEQFDLPGTDLILLLGTSSLRIYELQKSHVILRVATFLLLVGALGGGIVYLLLRKLSRPINTLRLTMEKVAKGSLHSRYAPQRWGFEVNAIGRYFNETLDALLLHQKQAESERVKREILAQELKLGQEIQTGLLPREFPLIRDLDIGAGCLQAKEVGGDFYDVFPLSSGNILIVVADLAGKGISACLFSLGLRSSLRALAETTDNLSQLLRKANDLFLLDAGETGEFATLWLGILEERTLHYASLGHPPALIKRQGKLIELSTHHPAMGLMPFSTIRAHSHKLETDDELLFYSDGATEAHDAEEQLFGIDRLKQSFLQCTGAVASVSAAQILKDIQLFSKGVPQHDDLTLLVIRVL